MTLTSTAPDSSGRRSLKSRLAALTVGALALSGLTFGIAAPATADPVPVVNLDTDEVQLGSYQTYFPENFEGNALAVELWQGAEDTGTLKWFDVLYLVGGKPDDPYPRVLINSGWSTGTYTIVAWDNYSNHASVEIEVVSQVTDASVSIIGIDDSDYEWVEIQGSGWLRDDWDLIATPTVVKDRDAGAGVINYTLDRRNSVVGVKHESTTGNLVHADTSGDYAPAPRPWPVGGASPGQLWYYIGNPGLTSTSYPENGATGFPNGDYSVDFDSTGSFTALIEFPGGLASGTHTLRFLTGSLVNNTFNEGSSYPDVARSITVTIVVP